MRLVVTAILTVVSASAAVSGGRAEAEVFFGLGDLTGGSISSRAWGISADGLTIVGESDSGSGTQAFRWSPGEGMVGLGDLDGGSGSVAYGVSSDGSVIVGSGRSSASGDGREAFRWTASQGMVGLGDLDGGDFDSVAFGVSGDGSVVVGTGRIPFQGSGSSSSAFRWTSSDGMTSINPGSALDPFYPNLSGAYGVSSDGSTVAGRFSAPTPFEDARAGRWVEGSGWAAYPGETWTDAGGRTMAASADGSVLVGSVKAPPSGLRHNAFRWEQGGEAVFLHEIPDDGSSPFGNTIATAVSADGAIILGNAFAPNMPTDLGQPSALSTFSRPFIWDEVNGFRLLQDDLIGLGLDLTGWTLLEARGISAGGTILTGTGINPSGEIEAWFAEVGGSIGGAAPPVVPEPTSLALMLLGSGMIVMVRRGRVRARRLG